MKNRINTFLFFGILIPGLIFIILLLPREVYAAEYTATDFKVKDPIISIGWGAQSTSNSFKVVGAVGQVAIGISATTSFGIRSGFLYFPKVIAPVVSATAGDGWVALSWTASQGFSGWTVSGYNVGQSTASGGPYAYTSLGNVTSSTRTGLSNGITYYFIIRAEDAFGNSIAASAEVSATPVTAVGGEGIIMTLLRQFISFLPVPPEFVACALTTDLNCDGRVDLKDLSIFLYLEPKPTPNPADFNKDKKIDTRDLSLLFFDWTKRLLGFEPEGILAIGAERKLPQENQERPVLFKSAVVSETLTAQKPELKVSQEEGVFEKMLHFIAEIFGKIRDFFKKNF